MRLRPCQPSPDELGTGCRKRGRHHIRHAAQSHFDAVDRLLESQRLLDIGVAGDGRGGLVDKGRPAMSQDERLQVVDGAAGVDSCFAAISSKV